MAFVCWSLVTLALEYMTQMPPTSCACDLSSPPIRVRLKLKRRRRRRRSYRSIYRSSKTFIESRPKKKKNLQIDLSQQEDLHRKQASHSQSWIWWWICKEVSHNQHNCKLLAQKTYHILHWISACMFVFIFIYHQIKITWR